MNREALTIGFFRPEDAEGVAKLFTEIYGDGYPAKIVYHPDQLLKAFENRDNIPVVVRSLSIPHLLRSKNPSRFQTCFTVLP